MLNGRRVVNGLGFNPCGRECCRLDHCGGIRLRDKVCSSLGTSCSGYVGDVVCDCRSLSDEIGLRIVNHPGADENASVSCGLQDCSGLHLGNEIGGSLLDGLRSRLRVRGSFSCSQ